jgi:hypothetical protein
MNSNYTKEELELIESIEKDEWVPIENVEEESNFNYMLDLRLKRINE